MSGVDATAGRTFAGGRSSQPRRRCRPGPGRLSSTCRIAGCSDRS